MIEWHLAEASLGHELGQGADVTAAIRDYAKWAKTTERTAWNQLARFRRGFPGEETPARIVAHLRHLHAGAVDQRAAVTLSVFAPA
ncbi:MAG TPA: hypothetical protein VGW11_12830 [Solirubrobacteraceae bacterium]|nr:hypothetical protein [Solirubrobacteraceae bacterium]